MKPVPRIELVTLGQNWRGKASTVQVHLVAGHKRARLTANGRGPYRNVVVGFRGKAAAMSAARSWSTALGGLPIIDAGWEG